MRFLLGLLLASLGGCGGNVVAEPGPSGTLAPGAVATGSTRLRLRVLESSTGVQVPLGFHDTTLDLDCQVGSDARGVMRCLPDAPVAGPFADASCSTPAVSVRESCTPPRYASLRANECAFGPRTFHAVGGRLEAAFSPGSGACVATSAISGDVFYGASAEDHTERFAAFSEQRRSLGSRFDRRVFVSVDGAEWSTSALFDRELGLECYPRLAVDGGLRCLPDPIHHRGPLYGDAACSKPLMAVNACAPASAFSSPICAGHRAFRIVGPFSGVAYDGRDGGCSASSLPGPFTQLEELLPEKLGAVGSELGAGGVDTNVVDGNRIVAGAESLRDPATGERCHVMRDPGGNLRCVPDTPVYFSDSACTRPVVRVPTLACSAAPPKRASLLAYNAAQPCSNSMQVSELYEVGAELAMPGDVLYTKSDATLCLGIVDTKNARVFEAKPLGLAAAPPWRIVTL